MSDQIRDAFEALIKRDCGDLTTFGSGKNCHYLNSGVNHEWIGYQAGRLAALEESQPKWLPIETAPRDGTWILVAGPDQTGAGRMVCRMVREQLGWESADDGYGAYIQPTHWMPLPANPTTERPAALKE